MNVFFYPMTSQPSPFHQFPKQHCFRKVPKLRPFVLLVRATCRWRWVKQHWRIDTDRGKLKYSEKNLSQGTPSTLNLTRTNLESNPCLCGNREAATNCLSHGTACLKVQIIIIILRFNSYRAVNALTLYYKTNQLMLYRKIIVMLTYKI